MDSQAAQLIAQSMSLGRAQFHHIGFSHIRDMIEWYQAWPVCSTGRGVANISWFSQDTYI